MMYRVLWLGVALSACGGSRQEAQTAFGSSRQELQLVGNTGNVDTGTHIVQVLLGDALDVTGTSVREGFTIVSSDSPRTVYKEMKNIAVSCRGAAGSRCDINGTRISPRNPGEYKVTASAEGVLATWSVSVVDAEAIELAPCGELTVEATYEHGGGVAIVAPTLVVRTKQGTRLPALGAMINDKPISDPSFYSLRATTTPTTHTLRGRYRQFVTACRVTVQARPMKS